MTLDRVASATSMCETAADFYRRGWCVATSGNLSARVADDPLEVLVSVSGRDKGQLTPEDFVRIDASGATLGADPRPASAEARIHLEIFRSRRASHVLHTHSVASTLLGEHFASKGGFTLAGYEMLKGFDEQTTHEATLFVPILGNRQDMVRLADEVAACLSRHPACPGFLLAGHGLYAWGRDLDQARRHVEAFEFLFELVLRRTSLAPFQG